MIAAYLSTSYRDTCRPVQHPTVPSVHSTSLRDREKSVVTQLCRKDTNKKRERDPEMHQTKKGNEWFFGMKMHIGVDEKLGLVHTLATTAANVHDIAAADQLLHGKEKAIWADAGYQGIGKREEHEDRKVRWHVAMKPGKRSQLDPDGKEAKKEKAKASIRAKVEHPFLYVKRVFGYSKVRYRGLAKNTERLNLLLGFANLLIGARYA